MEKKDFFCVGLEGHSFQEALGCEVSPEGKATIQSSEMTMPVGRRKRWAHSWPPETRFTVCLEAELFVGSKAGRPQPPGNVHS